MKYQYTIVCLLFYVITSYGQKPDNPGLFRNEIEAFRNADSVTVPEPGLIVFTGSSSIRGWHELDTYFPERRVINRGFGGSRWSDALYYFDDIVTPYQPGQVVLYSGENDIAAGKSPRTVKRLFKAFYKRFTNEFPDTPLIYVSIKPSIARWAMFEDMQKANTMIRRYIRRKKHVDYVDVVPGMLDENGKPLPEIFLGDGLHMNPSGYAIWKKELLPLLIRNK